MTDLLSAFAGGLLSFLSPCILPILPGFLSLISEETFYEVEHTGGRQARVRKRRAGLSALCFVAGFSLAFVLLGASASAVGQIFARYAQYIVRAAGILIILLGLHAFGVVRVHFLNFHKRIPFEKFNPGLAGAFFMGLAFAVGWTPCIGPLLAGFLALAATYDGALKGMFLLFAYSLGLGLPFIIAGFGADRSVHYFRRYRKFVRYTEKIAGALLVIIGIALLLRSNIYVLRKLIPL